MGKNIKIRLNEGKHQFECATPPVRVDRYTPDAEVEEKDWSNTLSWGVQAGIISVIDEDKVSAEQEIPPETFEEGSPIWRDEEGKFTTEDKDADGVPEVIERPKKVKRPTTKKQCTAETASGKQCKNKALKYLSVCVKHATDEELATVDDKLAQEG